MVLKRGPKCIAPRMHRGSPGACIFNGVHPAGAGVPPMHLAMFQMVCLLIQEDLSHSSIR